MVVEITEEHFIQAMWKAYPHSFTTDSLRAIWEYLEEKDKGEVFTPEFINDFFTEHKISDIVCSSDKLDEIKEEIRSNPEFIVVDDNTYLTTWEEFFNN